MLTVEEVLAEVERRVTEHEQDSEKRRSEGREAQYVTGGADALASFGSWLEDRIYNDQQAAGQAMTPSEVAHAQGVVDEHLAREGEREARWAEVENAAGGAANAGVVFHPSPLPRVLGALRPLWEAHERASYRAGFEAGRGESLRKATVSQETYWAHMPERPEGWKP